MFRIRRIFDDTTPTNIEALKQVRTILREQFPALDESDIEKIPDLLRNPLKHRFRAILYVVEDHRATVNGFAFVSHDPQLRFFYLDYISAAAQATGGGIGGALYERLREEALSLDCRGIFFECLPDDPKLCRNPEILKQNEARLKFYEQYSARPITGTTYETPVKEGDDNPPYLVFDGLGRNVPLPREEAKKIVRAILERRYAHLCPPEYVNMVVASFRDDPVRLREARYATRPTKTSRLIASGRLRRIPLVVNDRHSIHHVRERGYVEAPVRIDAIMKELATLDLFEAVAPKEFPERNIRVVHTPDFVDYLKRACRRLEPGKSLYPYVFPIRNQARPPKELAVRAGYYCIDTFTPINQNAYLAAKRGVDCALTAANKLLEGYRLAYALVRPPGHHAEIRSFGGFCYFNNAAVAAEFLCRFGTVAILDVDYHHGNGQQMIFYDRSDILTVSIHGDPKFAYPYFSGFEDETGEGSGAGLNLNIPLPEQIDPPHYFKSLDRALRRIKTFAPTYLIVCLGFDTAKGDPTGTWSLRAADFEAMGKRIGGLRVPTLTVQEGGYRTRTIGINARQFFTGLWRGMFEDIPKRAEKAIKRS